MQTLKIKDALFSYRPRSSDEIVIDEMLKQDMYQIGKMVRPGETWHDLGANIGLFSLLTYQMGAKAIAYEPDEQNGSVLEKNLSPLKIPIKPYAVVGNANIPQFLHHPPGGQHWQAQVSQLELPGTVAIETVAFDEIIGKGDCVKMDVEGAETDIILSSQIQTWEKVDKLIMEYHHDRSNDEEFAACIQKLQQAGLVLPYDPVDDEHRRLEKPHLIWGTRLPA